MVGRAGLAIAMQSPDSASLRLKPFASPLMRIRQWFEPSSARKKSVHRNDERFSKKMVGRAGLAIAMQSPDSASLRLKPFASPLMRIRQWFEPSSARTKKRSP
jgi:hypothetical protein